MNWQIEWGGDVVFGYDFAGILADALEIFTETLRVDEGWPQWEPADFGHHCDSCGRYAMTWEVEFNDVTSTDRGEERRLIAYELCAECRPEFFDARNENSYLDGGRCQHCGGLWYGARHCPHCHREN